MMSPSRRPYMPPGKVYWCYQMRKPLMEGADKYLALPMKSYDLDIEPDDIEAADTVTVVWEIE